MPHSVLIEDDGFVTFRLGDKTSKQADLYALNNRLLALGEESKQLPPEEQGTAWFNAVQAIMEELELPAGSYRAAEKFARGVFAQVAALKKSDGASTVAAQHSTTAPGSSGLTPDQITDSL